MMLITFFLVLSIGIPISMSMGIATLVGLITGGHNISVLPQMLQQATANYTLICIPYFILAANIMNGSGITRRIFAFADALVGWMTAGMAQVNVFASMIFAGISGTANSDAAGLGLIEIEAMKEQGYDAAFSTSVTLASSILGPIIPPSVPFIVYATLASVSVVDLFLAGLIPGLFLAVCLMGTSYFLVKTGRVKAPPRRKFSTSYLWKTIKEGFWALLAPLVLLGCIMSGTVTASESGIIAIVYSIIVALGYREFSLKSFIHALHSTLMSSVTILFIIGMGYGIGWVLTIERVPQDLTIMMLSLTQNKYIILFLINIFLLILGCFMDGTTIRLITVPLFLPVLKALDISILQFGVVHTFTTCIGFCTPPVGVGLMIMCSISKLKFSEVVKAFIPYYIPLIVVLLAMTYIPPLTTWLPSLIA